MKNSVVADWFYNAILAGLQRLIHLNLRGKPPLETIGNTAEVWADTLWYLPSIGWIEHLDTPRIQQTFLILCQRHKTFPNPADFIETFKGETNRVVEDPLLPPPELTEVERANGWENLEKLKNLLKNSKIGASNNARTGN